jgi:transposase
MKNPVDMSTEGIAAYVGIDWADQKHDVVLRSVTHPTKVEHQVISCQPDALLDWVAKMQQRFGGKGKILVCLEQSRGALIYHLMGYDFFELYPINPSQLAHYRTTFVTSGAKDDQPDAELLCELLMVHRDRLKAWKPDSELTRKLATLNEDRRQAVDERTRLSHQIKSQLKTFYPLALQILDNDTTTALAADLLLQWPCLEAIQKQSPSKLRKFFYGHNCRGEAKMLERLSLINQAKALTHDLAVIEPAALKIQMLAQQLKDLLAYIARYEKLIAQLFGAHPDHFLFDHLPGAGAALAPRLLTAFGSDRSRFDSARDHASLSGIGPIRIASGKKVAILFRHACPKFLRQSWHEFAACSIRSCEWAKAFYDAQIARGKTHHVAVRALAFKWIRILFACWKQRIPYNPERYLHALQKRRSPYASASAPIPPQTSCE